MVKASDEAVEEEVEVEVATVESDPPDAADLLKRIVALNKQKIWPSGCLITVDSLKLLRTVSGKYAFRILDRLEQLGGDVDEPCVHIYQAVKRVPAAQRCSAKAAAKRAATATAAPVVKRARIESSEPYAPPPRKGKGKGKMPPPATRAQVGDKIQELVDKGVDLSVQAVTALFKVNEQVAMAVLHDVADRASVQDASKFVLEATAKEERRSGRAPAAAPAAEEAKEETGKKPLPNPELFKMRFGQAVAAEEARKGRGKKGK